MDKAAILARTTERLIYQFYFRVDSEPNKYYENKIAGSNSKTLKFYTNGSGELLFKDFSPQRENFKGDIIKCAMLCCGLTKYHEAVARIDKDLNLGLFSIKTAFSRDNRTEYYAPKPPSNIKVTTQEFTESDLDYWRKFNIDTDLLKLHNVYSLKASYLNDNLWLTSTPHRPLFGYEYNKLWKIYCPLRKDAKKWCGNWNRNCIGSFANIDYTKDYLIISSSIKDGLVLSTHGYNQISIPSENTIPTILKEIIDKFKVVYAFLDFDEAGHKWNSVLEKTFTNVKAVNIFSHTSIPTKDISDFSKEYGYIKTSNLLKFLFNEYP